MLEVELPFPPSVNHYWRMWRGRMVISTEGRAYRERIGLMLRAGRHSPGLLLILFVIWVVSPFPTG
jgi:Holliday junction resolvase RusA-like endonuclease